jgi:cytochrome c-type biogenesis protein CcmF
MVSWIWWSLPLFVLGALIAAWPERRRARADAAEPLGVPGKAPSPGAAA